MPLKDCPFLKLSKEDISRPLLPINIINPHTGLSYATFGIIDTGADECAIPAGIASILGHNLQAGNTKIIGTGNGETIAFAHTTKFEIYDPLVLQARIHNPGYPYRLHAQPTRRSSRCKQLPQQICLEHRLST